MDSQAFLGALPEALREVEQRLADPAGHVGEDEVRHDVVGAAQPLREGAQQVEGHLRTSGQPGPQVVVAETGQEHVGQGDRARRTGAGVEQGQFAEHLARAEHAEQVLAAVGGGAD